MTLTAAQSRWIEIAGPLHYLDFGGPASGPVIICVHGLGGSAVNWVAIAPLLTGRFRLLAPDLAGHGLTRPSGRSTDVAANRALLHRFIEAVPVMLAAPGAAAGPVRPVILMGNSMGGMISLLEASAAPRGVAGLILLDPALPFVLARPDPVVAAMFALYATPGLGRALMSRRRSQSPEQTVARILALCCADVSLLDADVVARHVEVARQRAAFGDTSTEFTAAMRSVVATVGRGSQAYRRAIGSIACPVLLLHGDRDRLVPVAVARATARANPSWSLVVLPGVGHVPQLEAPRHTEQAITTWLGSAGRAVVPAAAPGPAAEVG
jgi:pimeloyl-ACP methyl ester carboxylesterase